MLAASLNVLVIFMIVSVYSFTHLYEKLCNLYDFAQPKVPSINIQIQSGGMSE